MTSPSDDDVIDAFVEVVRNELKMGNPVEVPGLGTFQVEHRSSQRQEIEGETVLTPPRDVVTFEPERQ